LQGTAKVKDIQAKLTQYPLENLPTVDKVREAQRQQARQHETAKRAKDLGDQRQASRRKAASPQHNQRQWRQNALDITQRAKPKQARQTQAGRKRPVPQGIRRTESERHTRTAAAKQRQHIRQVAEPKPREREAALEKTIKGKIEAFNQQQGRERFFLRQRHLDEQERERRQREQRLRTGLLGHVDRLTGRAARVRANNRQEAQDARERRAEQWQTLQIDQAKAKQVFERDLAAFKKQQAQLSQTRAPGRAPSPTPNHAPGRQPDQDERRPADFRHERH
jgi:hypothetical protein